MSDLTEIIELTEKITQNSNLLVGKVIELSYAIQSGAGVGYIIFAFAVAGLSCLFGHLFARYLDVVQNGKFTRSSPNPTQEADFSKNKILASEVSRLPEGKATMLNSQIQQKLSLGSYSNFLCAAAIVGLMSIIIATKDFSLIIIVAAVLFVVCISLLFVNLYHIFEGGKEF